jgi:hypothetical protein
MRGFRRFWGADKEVQKGPWGNAWGNMSLRRMQLKLAQSPRRKPALVTARAQKHGAIHHDDVSVVAASSV